MTEINDAVIRKIRTAAITHEEKGNQDQAWVLLLLLDLRTEILCIKKNPMITLGTFMKKHPKIALVVFILAIILLGFFSSADMRGALLDLAGLDPKYWLVTPTP